MSERLSDGQLRQLEQSSGDDCDMTLVESAVDELRTRRAADLSAEEREALEFAEGCVEVQHQQAVRESAADGCEPSPHWRDKAVATIRRLIGAQP